MNDKLSNLSSPDRSKKIIKTASRIYLIFIYLFTNIIRKTTKLKFNQVKVEEKEIKFSCHAMFLEQIINHSIAEKQN